ncbi:unnamed protein product [Musa banksii]
MPSRPPPAEPPGPHRTNHNHHHHHHRHVIPIAAIGGAAVVLTVTLVVLLYRRFARGSPTPTAPSPPPPPAGPLRRFTYAQLRRATASFAPSLRLGQGGFGPVFRGALPSGEEVAVKLMDSCGSLQGEREFHNELALAANILAVPSYAAAVVPTIGFCSDDDGRHRRWWPWWRRREAEEPLELSEAAAAAAPPGRKLLLVYELMHNGSLQDALLDRRCPELMDWQRRFAVVLDVARGLHFLHAVCDPAVIHGDIKPSNILLDAHLSAKIGDFGLARLRSTATEDHLPTEEEIKVDIDLDKHAVNDSKTSGKERKKDSVTVGGQDDASAVTMGETAESITTTTTGFEEQTPNAGANGIATTDRSAEEDEDFMVASPATAVDVASVSEAGAGFDRVSVDSGKDASASRKGCGKKKAGASSGKDWWWRQDINGGGPNSESGGSVKDYVMEWIRSEIKKERPKSDWVTASTATAVEECLPKPSNGGRSERKKSHRRMEWWASLDEEKPKKKEKSRPAREWWREEFCEELMKKQKRQPMAKSKSSHEWWQNDDDFASPSEKSNRRKKNRSYSRGSRSSIDWWMDRISGEIRPTGRRSSRDWASGDIPKSGTVSSTPSMRGTVCYVAPEYGGGGPLSEKCDVYSFGVLLLVIISGRRPLQVTASPMSEFERANLISWARHLAHLGRLLELADPCLRCVDKEQALLCITVALLCLQRSPARRPSSKEILGMLTGESEPPHLPLEFSPSPPGGFSFKSRKKARNQAKNSIQFRKWDYCNYIS